MEIMYEIYALNAWGSDVVTKYSYAEALECAKEWSKESPNTEIVIDKVTKEYQIVTFKGGNQKNG